MTTTQKIIKYLALAFAIFLVVSILGGILKTAGLFGMLLTRDATLPESKVYSIEDPVQSLRLQINAADLTIRQGDVFQVESNLKYLSVSVKNGVLSVVEDKKYTKDYKGATLILYIPADTVFEKADITTGACKLTAHELSANILRLELGAGDVLIRELNALHKADIEGGAGKVTVSAGTIHDLELNMGVGELNLSAALLGSSELHMGVGQANLTLLGGQDLYRVEIEKGIGTISVNGTAFSGQEKLGNGQNDVEIEGGVGSITLKFE